MRASVPGPPLLLLTVMTSEATCPQWYSHHHTARPPSCGSHLNCVAPKTHPTCRGESETRGSSSNVCQTLSSGQQEIRRVLLAAGNMGHMLRNPATFSCSSGTEMPAGSPHSARIAPASSEGKPCGRLAFGVPASATVRGQIAIV